jgi:serine/threonine-protein kinase
MSWHEGRTIYDLSRDRNLDLATRTRIALQVVDAYAELHRHGVLHGDVHPANVMVGAEAEPMLIDFGAARWEGHVPDVERAGVLEYYEPEAAREVLAGRAVPAPTALGEQYCVAALAFRLITGSAPLLLSLDGRVALRQIVEQTPRMFADAGIVWTGLERVLRRALAKTPRERFENMTDFRNAMAAAAATGFECTNPSSSRRLVGPSGRDGVREALLAIYGPDGELLDTGPALGPTASLYYGAAGVAYALLRAAIVDDDAELLASADLWIERAVVLMTSPSAFVGPKVGIYPSDFGPAALFHTGTGVQLVRALVRQVAGDCAGTTDALGRYIDMIPSSDGDREGRGLSTPFALDLMNGNVSHLLGTTLLRRVCVDADEPSRARLAQLGGKLAASVAADVAAGARGGGARYLGMAHGVAGAIYALARWAEVDGVPLREDVLEVADWLADRAESHSDGLAWPVQLGPSRSERWVGWCHGSAGYVLLWSLLAHVRGRDVDRGRAIGAARYLWAHREHSNPSLCCGLAGEALALSALARLVEAPTWAERGSALLARTMTLPFDALSPHSLFRGRLGAYLAQLELGHPETSAFPLCDPVL